MTLTGEGSSLTVSDRTVPAGQPLYQLADADTIQVKTKSGYSFGWVSQVLKPTGKSLNPVKYRVALPKGKSISRVTNVVLAIPPGGSAPLIAKQTCLEFGVATVALQSVSGGRDSARLASQGLAVAKDLLRQNPDLKFIFSGFSMGGFGAQHLGQHFIDRCTGLLLIGNYYLDPPFPAGRPVVMLVGASDMHLGYAEKSLKEQSDYGTNIQLLTMPGGHGYGRQQDQDRALKALIDRIRR